MRKRELPKTIDVLKAYLIQNGQSYGQNIRPTRSNARTVRYGTIFNATGWVYE